MKLCEKCQKISDKQRGMEFMQMCQDCRLRYIEFVYSRDNKGQKK